MSQTNNIVYFTGLEVESDYKTIPFIDDEMVYSRRPRVDSQNHSQTIEDLIKSIKDLEDKLETEVDNRKELQDSIRTLGEDNSELRKKYEDSEKLKEQYKDYIRQNKSNGDRYRQKCKKLEFHLEEERNKSKCLELQRNTFQLEIKTLSEQLDQEKRKTRLVTDHQQEVRKFQVKVIELEARLAEQAELIAKQTVDYDVKVQRIRKVYKKEFNDLEIRLAQQAEDVKRQMSDHNMEVMDTEKAHKKELKELECKLKRYKRLNEKAKRERLAAQVTHHGNGEIYGNILSRMRNTFELSSKASFSEFATDMLSLINNQKRKNEITNKRYFDDIQRECEQSLAENSSKSRRLLEENSDGSVLCIECDRTFSEVGNLCKHMTRTHKKNFNPSMEVPNDTTQMDYIEDAEVEHQ